MRLLAKQIQHRVMRNTLPHHIHQRIHRREIRLSVVIKIASCVSLVFILYWLLSLFLLDGRFCYYTATNSVNKRDGQKKGLFVDDAQIVYTSIDSSELQITAWSNRYVVSKYYG